MVVVVVVTCSNMHHADVVVQAMFFYHKFVGLSSLINPSSAGSLS